MAKQLIINGVAVVAPSSFSVGIQDIDGESGRNANGTMVRDRIARKRKLDCEWGMLADAEISQLLNAVEPEFFDVTYPDPMLGGQATITAYVGDRTAPAYNWAGVAKPWSGLKMNFVER